MTCRAALALIAGGVGGVACAQHQGVRFRDGTSGMLPTGFGSSRTMDVEVADVTGDGLLDIVIAGEFAPNAVLASEPTSGVIASENGRHGAFLGFAAHDSEDIAIADFNGDGRLDIVYVSEDDVQDELHLGVREEDSGRPAWRAAHGRMIGEQESNCVLAHDIDGDGDPDLILGGRGPALVMLNDGSANFEVAEGWIPADDRTTQDMELGDVDGDGDLDLIVANEDGNRLLINNGSGVFTDETEGRLPTEGANEETREADFGDVDGDGDLDLFFANVGWRPGMNPQNRLLINNGEGVFTDESSARLPGGQPLTWTTLDADFADLEGDGDLDLVLGNTNGQPVQLWLNDGSGKYADMTVARIPTPAPFAVIDIEVADFNGDGKLDIYASNAAGADRVFVQD